MLLILEWAVIYNETQKERDVMFLHPAAGNKGLSSWETEQLGTLLSPIRVTPIRQCRTGFSFRNVEKHKLGRK